MASAKSWYFSRQLYCLYFVLMVIFTMRSLHFAFRCPKCPPAPYIQEVGNLPGKLAVSTLSES